jgi:uncharacterized protein (DUF305 family)
MNKNLQKWLMMLALISNLVAAAPTQNARPHSARDSAAWSELTANMEKMHIAVASVKSSGNSDADFVALMVPHHQAAIEMAKSELLNGKDPQMRRVAQEIIIDQQSEIELMKLWLKEHPAQLQ